MKAVVDFGDHPPWVPVRFHHYTNGARRLTVYKYQDGSKQVFVESTISRHVAEPGPTPYEIISLGYNLPRGCLSIQGDPDIYELRGLRERLERVQESIAELRALGLTEAEENTVTGLEKELDELSLFDMSGDEDFDDFAEISP